MKRKVMSFDPSSSVIGYAWLDYVTEHLGGGGLIRGKAKTAYLDRIDVMLTEVSNVLIEQRPKIILVEVPVEKQYMPKYKQSGAPVWAVAAGEVAGVCRSYAKASGAAFRRVSNLWTRGSEKGERQLACTQMFLGRYHPKKDPGMDLSDAIMMALKWIKSHKAAKAMLDRQTVVRSR